MKMILKVVNLRAHYAVQDVLHGINFEVAEHGITTLLGANGAGKTTTLRAICGLVRTDGDIVFDGEPIQRRLTEHIARAGIAHVPDGRGTFLEFSVDENLRLGAYLRRDKDGIANDLERVFHYFPRLKERRNQQAGSLSGGEQQMLAVSRAMMLRPKLLVLDEPSFGLAPLVVRDLFEIFRVLNKQEGISILIVEQNARMALELADQAYLLETGRCVMSGPAASLRDDEQIRRSYLGY
jgi:branched-chain amino acid transport system ATP-binding protein